MLKLPKEHSVKLVDPTTYNVGKIKEIVDNHSSDRSKSKTVTFALQYAGTAKTLVSNSGFSLEEAKQIVNNYHDLYKVSTEYKDMRLEQATKDGYASVAFGLRVRTPLLSQVLWDKGNMPYEAEAEGRTVGNALFQSYGMLNNRAANAFMQDVWASPYRLDIKPVAMIHDAIYILVRDVPEIVAFANEALTRAMQWQELPEIAHPEVKLGGALDIFWPNWSKSVTLPEIATAHEIVDVCVKHKHKILNPE